MKYIIVDTTTNEIVAQFFTSLLDAQECLKLLEQDYPNNCFEIVSIN